MARDWLRRPLPRTWAWIAALVGGALLPLSLAPFNYWPFGCLSAVALAAALQGRTAGGCFRYALLFNISLYGVGVSWVYISISQFGNSSVALAALLTGLFVLGLSLIFAGLFALYGRLFARNAWHWPLAFPAGWIFVEWVRSWLLTGFPWLYLGYGHINTPLAGYAPVFGVFGVGFAAVFSSCALVWGAAQWRAGRHWRWVWPLLGTALAIWPVGALLRLVQWTELGDTPVTVGMAQGNIPQELKWEPSFRDETFRIFNGLSESLWQYDWVIWPEAAIPLMYHRAEAEINQLDAKAKATKTTFITGILYDDWDLRRYYNSLIARGLGSGIAFKTRLVPFGEYVPLEHWLRGTIDFFNLPTSVIHPGPAYVRGLITPQGVLAPTICYEVVYPDLVAARARGSGALLTLSNDAWFGHSIGPIQHFQMARMRALESGRYMIRATNNGLSGIIDERGNTLVQGGRFTQETITGEIRIATGNTPFLLWGSWPVILSCIGLMVLAAVLSSARLKTSKLATGAKADGLAARMEVDLA